MGESAFSSYEIENLKVVPILFQTGYLTITGYDKERMEYTLAYPNFEVKNSMTECLTEAYSLLSSYRQGKILSDGVLSDIFTYRVEGESGSKDKQRADRRCYH